jgi:hypothetical protein
MKDKFSQIVLIVFYVLIAGIVIFDGKEVEYEVEHVEKVPTKPSISRMDVLWEATCYVESRNNPLAVGRNKDYGIIQITPIYVREVNRLQKDTVYAHEDAFCVYKSKEMWYIIQNHYNPTHDIEKAIYYHNKASWYKTKVLDKYNELFLTYKSTHLVGE